MDIIRTIKENYVNYNAPRRRIADYILKDPMKCSFSSLKELSLNASTSEVTILSFCKDLGLSSFVELKRNLKEYIFANKSPEERFRHYVSSSNGDISRLYEDVIKALHASVEETTRLNDFARLSKGIDLIIKAKRIFIAAHGASRIPADYIKLRFTQLGLSITIMDSESTIQNIAQLKVSNAEETLLISIATPPYGKSTVAMTELCRSLGIPIIAFTDSELSPLVRLADVSYICMTAESFKGLLNSYSSFFCIIEVLNMLYYNVDECLENDDSFHALIEKYYELLEP